MTKELICDKKGCSGRLESYKGTLSLESMTIVDVPVLVCSICKTRSLTDEVVSAIEYMLADAKGFEERTKSQITRALNFRFQFEEKNKL